MPAFFQIFYMLTISLIVILGKLGRENRSNFPFLSLHCSGSLSSFFDLLWVSNENFQSQPSKLHTFLICSHLFLQPCGNSVMSEAQTTLLKDPEVRFYLPKSLSAHSGPGAQLALGLLPRCLICTEVSQFLTGSVLTQIRFAFWKDHPDSGFENEGWVGD